MEYHESQREKYKVSSLQEPPASLLSGVMSRLEQRNMYLTTHKPLHELVQVLNHPQWEVRSAAVRALGKLGEQASADTLDPLLTALQDEHHLVRAAAVRALGRLGAHVPVDQLILALEDHEWEVREMALLVLGELGERSLRPLFVASLQDSHHTVREAATEALKKSDVASPSISVFRYMKVHTLAQNRKTALPSLGSMLLHFWLVLKGQIPIIQRNWMVSILVLVFGYGLSLFTIMQVDKNASDAAQALALFTTIASAVGVAFVSHIRGDVGLEITLSTPTSLRIVTLCRFLLVISSNVLLSMAVSAIIVLFYGESFWNIVQLWLGPMLLLSSLALAFSLLIGSWLSCLAAFFLEAWQTLRISSEGHALLLQLGHTSSWETNPLILSLAILCMIFAFLYAPRHVKLSREQA